MEASSTTPCPQHHHPPTSRPVCGNLVFHKTNPWCQKGLGDCCSRWYGIHLQPWHLTSGHQGWTHLTKYYLSLLFYPSSGFPWGLSIFQSLLKNQLLVLPVIPTIFSFYEDWRMLMEVWFGVIIVWLVGWLVFSFPSIPFHQPLNFSHQWQPTSPVFNVPFQKYFVLIHLWITLR